MRNTVQLKLYKIEFKENFQILSQKIIDEMVKSLMGNKIRLMPMAEMIFIDNCECINYLS